MRYASEEELAARIKSEMSELDSLKMPMDIVVKGQDELGFDYIEIADYMLERGYKPEQINKCFSVWSGKNIRVVTEGA